jgi:COMPASS component SWD2
MSDLHITRTLSSALVKTHHVSISYLIACVLIQTLDQIFYWSIHENEIIKVFEGHNEEVTTLHMNPSDDTFVSIGGNSTLKVFNLAEDHESPIALLDLKDEGCQMAANFDSTGVVLAVSVF